MKLKNLITKICVVLLFLSATSFVEAQKKKSVTKRTNRTQITATNTELIPMLKDFAFVVRIDKDWKPQVSQLKTYLKNPTDKKSIISLFNEELNDTLLELDEDF